MDRNVFIEAAREVARLQEENENLRVVLRALVETLELSQAARLGTIVAPLSETRPC